ncbi:MAG: hypothetical protein H6700_11220 [Myxococcales bacterium]|nr:hypothetical protein [Myxococcales bacterium]
MRTGQLVEVAIDPTQAGRVLMISVAPDSPVSPGVCALRFVAGETTVLEGVTPGDVDRDLVVGGSAIELRAPTAGAEPELL